MKKTVDVENSVIILGIHCVVIPDLYLNNSMATLLQLLHVPSQAQRNACLGYLVILIRQRMVVCLPDCIERKVDGCTYFIAAVLKQNSRKPKVFLMMLVYTW